MTWPMSCSSLRTIVTAHTDPAFTGRRWTSDSGTWRWSRTDRTSARVDGSRLPPRTRSCGGVHRRTIALTSESVLIAVTITVVGSGLVEEPTLSFCDHRQPASDARNAARSPAAFGQTPSSNPSGIDGSPPITGGRALRRCSFVWNEFHDPGGTNLVGFVR
jgi:hypothetical protein